MKSWIAIGVLVVLLGSVAFGVLMASNALGEKSGLDPDLPIGSQPGQPGNLQPSPSPDPNMVKQKAQIESTSVAIAESYPPQYFLQVKYGLPDGCSRPGGYDVNRSGGTVSVTVYVARPAAKDIVCTMIYRTDSYNIPLGSDFESGKNYNVAVNSQMTSFKAQ